MGIARRAAVFVLAWALSLGALAHGVFTGPWGAGGHFIGSPILFRFVDPPATPGHPSRAWTAREQAVLREAFSEWDVLLCELCFQEVSTPFPDTITLRWEDSDFFGGALGPGSDSFIGWSYVYGIPDLGLGADYPQGEIYFNADVSWYVDPDPTTDEAIAADLWDLLTVAKHEIGHMLGLTHQYQDYFDAHPGFTPGLMDDRTVGDGGWGAGDRRHPTDADWEALRALDYEVHVAEPAAAWLAMLGLALVWRAQRQRAGVRVRRVVIGLAAAPARA